MKAQQTSFRTARLGGLAAAGLTLAFAGCGEEVAEEAQPVAAAANCAVPPANGAILERDAARGTGPHTIEIASTDAASTIVNVRDGASGAMVVSFYVAQGQSASIGDMPNGNYRIQYSTGGTLGADCSSFATPASVIEDPEIVEFEPGAAMTLTYDLTPTEDGNFDPQAIEPRAFNAD